MTINVAGLDEVLAHIETHPEKHDQGVYRCSTGMCVAGWRAELSGGQWAYAADDGRWLDLDEEDSARASDLLIAEAKDTVTYMVEGRVVTTVHDRASSLLGLTFEQATRLFSGSNRIEDIRDVVADLKAQAESEAP
jgi:hypothetical protein